MKNVLLLILSVTGLLFSGCASGKHYVIAATGTSIGVEIAQNPATQLYQAKLGYNRAELALVPSNRASGKKGDVTTGGGAADTTDVVMELNYGNVFNLTGATIYQRLAVGKQAVSQPGAAFMFAKGKDGTLDPTVATAVSRAISTVPAVLPDVTTLKVPLVPQYKSATDKTKFNEAAKSAGYSDFDAFLIDPKTTAAQVDAVIKALK
jgi:hypothetical protein